MRPPIAAIMIKQSHLVSSLDSQCSFHQLQPCCFPTVSDFGMTPYSSFDGQHTSRCQRTVVFNAPNRLLAHALAIASQTKVLHLSKADSGTVHMQVPETRSSSQVMLRSISSSCALRTSLYLRRWCKQGKATAWVTPCQATCWTLSRLQLVPMV